MAPILSFDTGRGVTVSVAGVPDEGLVERITAFVRRAFRHMVGKWSVGIVPGRVRGEWVMRLRGDFGIHIWNFRVSPEALPDVVSEKLAQFLRRGAEDISVTARPGV